MNWKLIFQLSLFGLFMGVATVYFIPFSVEPFCWLAIFVFSAYMIARECRSGRFLHGLFLGLANGVWVTGMHLLRYWPYLTRHPQEHEMLAKGIPFHPRMTLALFGAVSGLVSGIVLGLLALLAGKLMKTTDDRGNPIGQRA